MRYQDIEIKQNSQVIYLGCVMDKTISPEHVFKSYKKKKNGKLKFL